MLTEISAEEVAQNAFSFMNILNETLTFLITIGTEINNKLEIQNNQFEEKIRNFTNLIKKIKQKIPKSEIREFEKHINVFDNILNLWKAKKTVKLSSHCFYLVYSF